MKNYGLALEFVDQTLLNDKKIVMTAIKENLLATQFINEKFKKDRDILSFLTKKNKYLLKHFGL